MNYEEFAEWLRQELREHRLAESQVDDLLSQRLLFDNNRGSIETEFRLKVVGFVADEFYVKSSVSALLDYAAHMHPNRMLYFEPIGFRIF